MKKIIIGVVIAAILIMVPVGMYNGIVSRDENVTAA
jgi:hypothetical protein